MSHFEIVGLTKAGGPLTKRISLTEDGRLLTDGSHCIMVTGEARRITFDSLTSFARIIGGMGSTKAIALGALHPRLPAKVNVRTKRRLSELNGEASDDMICRTSEHIAYRPGRPGLVLVDFDSKGMPDHVQHNIDRAGGPIAALRQLLPELAQSGHVIRSSTSSCIFRSDTGQPIPGSNGTHIYVSVGDASDAERFLRTLHDRCWLSGFGWKIVGAAGQLLDRSIVDRMVYAAERLVFEGAPVLDEPLAQDVEARKPIVHDGPLLDTIAACPPLSLVERAELGRLQAIEAQRVSDDAGAARRKFIDERSRDLAQRRGMTTEHARAIIERQIGGVLLPDLILPFDDPDLAGITVRDVLSDPDRYVGETMADPIEGVAYGTGKAKIMRRLDGSLWIHSYAHGRTVYDLKLDAETVRAALQQAAPENVVPMFVRLALDAELAAEIEQIRDEVAKKTGTRKRRLDQTLGDARKQRDREQREEDRQRKQAERCDPRPELPVPSPDAPWLPVMQALNEVLGAATAAEPPARDIDGAMARIRCRRIPGTHLLTPTRVNLEDSGDESSLPPPEQPLLSRLDEPQLAEVIERHIEYVTEDGRQVHLPTAFVKHYLVRDDDALPIIASVTTLPIVLPGNELLAGRGLNRERGIVFRIPSELLSALPTPEECTREAAGNALHWLCDEWLCDVACDFTGKCILIAAALSVIERSVLPERPCFFVTAGRRGGGKTTTLTMLLMAITGTRPAAAAWSPNDEERRKALLAYMLEGLGAIVWDNIPRGTQISCPHIEKSCTTAFYSDRRLGVSESIAVAASVIHFFTGNNIGPRGDLTSRSLGADLEIDRADPENRQFEHPDPIAWTDAHRGEILRNLYTLMLANPANAVGSNVHPETRFKMWWRLVGSAVENAAKYLGAPLSFCDLFLEQESDDEESASLLDALRALEAQWSKQFQAADLARLLNDVSVSGIDEQRERRASLREFLFPNAPPNLVITAKAAGKRLEKHLGNPVRDGDRTLALKAAQDTHSKTRNFFVAAKTH